MYTFLRHTLRSKPPNTQLLYTRRSVSDARPFVPGDVVLLKEKLSRDASPIFTKPLKRGGKIEHHRGIIWHDDIIGKHVRDVVTSKTRSKKEEDQRKFIDGTKYRVHEVKLEDYVRLTKRLVTPIYPADAAVIVELLDLHPATVHGNNEHNAPKLEILEAGTGHGALTLFLSRAVHAANSHLRPPPLRSDRTAFESWKLSREAIIHTIEAKERYCTRAREVVSGFRHGIYSLNVDFYVSPVSEWVQGELANRQQKPFLSHAILDLPNADLQLSDVSKALRADGTIVVFNPSVTQILECMRRVKREKIPLELEKVVELPSGGGSGGREWDVRIVRPRKSATAAVDVESVSDVEGSELGDEGREGEAAQAAGEEAMICRPKVGDRIVGGGFLGVFKKWRDD